MLTWTGFCLLTLVARRKEKPLENLWFTAHGAYLYFYFLRHEVARSVTALIPHPHDTLLLTTPNPPIPVMPPPPSLPKPPSRMECYSPLAPKSPHPRPPDGKLVHRRDLSSILLRSPNNSPIPNMHTSGWREALTMRLTFLAQEHLNPDRSIRSQLAMRPPRRTAVHISNLDLLLQNN